MTDKTQEVLDRESKAWDERDPPETPEILKNWAVITFRLHPSFSFEETASMLRDMGALQATAEDVREWVETDARKKVGLHQRIDLRDFRWSSWVARVPLDNPQERSGD